MAGRSPRRRRPPSLQAHRPRRAARAPCPRWRRRPRPRGPDPGRILEAMADQADAARRADRASRARAAMVADQLRRRGIQDEHVLGAMAALPREAFVEMPTLSAAYDDRALPIPEG